MSMKKLTLHREGQEALFEKEVSDLKPGTCNFAEHVLLCLRGECVHDREYHEYRVENVERVDRFGGRDRVTFVRVATGSALAVPSAKAMPVANDATVAEQFRAQLGRVAEAEQNSLKQRVILGAMLIKWERFLGDGQGCKGEGLKGWLDKNLPELPYVRAHGYKQMAVKFLDMMGGGEMALEAMAGGETVTDPAGETVEIEAEIIEKRDEIFAAADSRRKLEQMWFDFSGEGPKKKGKAGRPKGSKAQYQGYQGEALQPAQAARALWSKVIEPAMDAGLGAAAKLLEEKDVADALAVLEPLVSILKQRKSEF